MELTQASAVRLTEILVSISCIVQTLEFFKIRTSFSDRGIWRWKTLALEFDSKPYFIKILSSFLRYESFILVLAIRLLCSLMLIALPHPIFVLILLISSLLVSLRWRGTFNGGSDYMTVLVLAILTLIRLYHDSQIIVTGALWYLALQTGLSYFVSGWFKLKNKNWRNGLALVGIMTKSNYEVPVTASAAAQNKKLSLIASWVVIIFEFTFLVSLFHPFLCLFFLASAFLFHLSNSYVLGLNRFMFAWLAAYPAFYFCSLQLR